MPFQNILSQVGRAVSLTANDGFNAFTAPRCCLSTSRSQHQLAPLHGVLYSSTTQEICPTLSQFPPPRVGCHWDSGAHYARTPPPHPGMKANLRGRISVANISQSGVKKESKKILNRAFPFLISSFHAKGRMGHRSLQT